MNDAPRVLVIQTAFLGDVILTTPLFAALKRKWPRAFVAALVIPETATALEGLPEVDDVIVYDKRRGGWRAFRRARREVKDRKFDVVIAPHRSARSAVLAWASAATVRVGYRESALPFLYTTLVTRAGGHEVDRILALARVLGSAPESRRPSLAVTEEERVWARGAAGGRKYALVSPSSAWPTKRWTVDGFAAVGDYLAGRGCAVVLTGGPGEEGVAAAVAAAMKTPPVNLAGATTVRQLVALVAEASVVAANDSAPVHIAAAFDISTVAVFGATVPAQGFGPLASQAVVAEVVGLACRPCGAHGGVKCPKKHFRCILDLGAEKVIDALAGVLS